MTKNNFKSKNGYTIIETMIAVSLFVVLILAGVGALLRANLVHNQSSNTRSILDNLSFIMEDISRHVRTGYNYRCYSGSNSWNSGEAGTPELNNPLSCAEGGALVFEDAYGVPADQNGPNTNDQWVYKIESTDGGETFNLSKSTDGGENFVRLNDSAVFIDGDSYFAVLGAEHPDQSLQSGDLQQPLVTIVLKGEIRYKNVITPFSLQTSVTQRLVDVTP